MNDGVQLQNLEVVGNVFDDEEKTPENEHETEAWRVC